MKQLIFICLLLFTLNCGERAVFWQPHSEFQKVSKSGTVLPNETFSLKKTSTDTRVLVLNFFAPDCKPCTVELPELEKINEKLSKMEGKEFVAIGSILSAPTPGDNTSLPEIAKAVAKFKTDFKVSYGSYLATGKQLNEFGITGFPETFILHRDDDDNWYVKRRYVSAITEKDVDQYLQP